MKRSVDFIVPDEYSGARVKGFLRAAHGFSEAMIRKMKLENAILVNGEPVFANSTLHAGDTVTCELCSEKENSDGIKPTDAPIAADFENEDILIVSKPCEMPTHPSHGHYNDSLANAVMGYYKRQGQNFVFRCVTRLDRETSGLCVIAKNAYAHEWLRRRLHTDEFIREYTALVQGKITGSGVIDAPIKRLGQSVILRTVAPDGDCAVTYYDPICTDNGRTLLRLRLKTGRTHQIRVHLAHIGHPIVGDSLYGSGEQCRLMLHSSRVSLTLPFSHTDVETVNKPNFGINGAF